MEILEFSSMEWHYLITETEWPGVQQQMHSVEVQEIHQVELLDLNGRLITKQTINQGSTIGYIDVSTIYLGNYLLRITSVNQVKTIPVLVTE